MKAIIFLIFLTASVFINGQNIKESNSSNGDYFVITEAYYIKNGTASDVNKEFADGRSGIMFMTSKDNSVVISLHVGSIDSVKYLGSAKKIANPGFKTMRDDAEFYSWLYVTHGNKEKKDAYIDKEYVTGSLEEKGKKYYYFNIVFSDNSQYQFYAYERDN
ncbi:MAG TPA: hypothetical protein PLR88_07660 [Bacteroidales bacterium]|nr:hypothetical protein [Bacteroidales bacterium]